MKGRNLLFKSMESLTLHKLNSKSSDVILCNPILVRISVYSVINPNCIAIGYHGIVDSVGIYSQCSRQLHNEIVNSPQQRLFVNRNAFTIIAVCTNHSGEIV